MAEFEIKGILNSQERTWERQYLDDAKTLADLLVSHHGFDRAEVVNTFGGHRSDPLYTVAKDNHGNLLKLYVRASDIKMIRENYFPRLAEKYLSVVLVFVEGEDKPQRIDAYECNQPTAQDKPTTFWRVKDRFGDNPKCECCSATTNLTMVHGLWLCISHADYGFGSDTTGEHANIFNR